MVSFAGGIPDPSLFEVDAFRDVYGDVLTRSESALQCSTTEGFPPLRRWIAQYMSDRGVPCREENVLVTHGSQQALDLIGKLFVVPGSSVIMTAPSYLGALQSFTAIAALAHEPNRIFRREAVSEGAQSFVRSLASRRSVLLTARYTAHCCELLGMWAWAPAFLMVTLGTQIGWSPAVLGVLVACMLHLFGAVATLLSGGLSDRLGRRLILVTMALAGAVSFTFDWSADWGATVLLVLAALYGFATIADSGVLSTAMTEAVATRHLGSMLALRSILGFGAGAFSPLAFGWVLDLTNPGLGEPTNWGWAFAALGIGGALTTLFALMLPGDRPRRSGRVPDEHRSQTDDRE